MRPAADADRTERSVRATSVAPAPRMLYASTHQFVTPLGRRHSLLRETREDLRASAKPVGDVVIDHTPTRIAWTVADPSNVGGLWTATAPTKLTIPADRESGRTLLLCAGAAVAYLTPGTEQAAIVIDKMVTVTKYSSMPTAPRTGSESRRTTTPSFKANS